MSEFTLDPTTYEKTISILEKSEIENAFWNFAKESIKSSPQKKETAKYVSERDKMRVHISGTDPCKLITTRRPAEPAEILEYRIAVYEPVTQPVLQEAMSAISIIWGSTSYSYSFDKKLNEYIHNRRFDGYSYFGWFQNIMQPFIYEDAMGFIVCLPASPDLNNSAYTIEPYICTVGCDSVCGWNCYEGELNVLVYKKSEKIYVILTPDVYYEVFLDKNEIYPISTYAHNLGFVPAIQCKGNWNTGAQMHQSFFSQFLPEANEYIKSYSDHNATMTVTGYPPRIVQPIQCSADGCHNGWINGIMGDDGVKCHTCKGTGVVEPSSPFSVYLAAIYNPALDSQNGINKDQDPIRYVERDTAILKFQMEHLQTTYEKMRRSVYLYQVENPQSGYAKELDMFPKQMHTLRISHNSFNIVRFISFCIQKYIDYGNDNVPVIIEPTIFEIKSEFELLQEYKLAKETGMPASRLQDLLVEIIQKRYAGDPVKLEREMFLMWFDPYYINDPAEKIELLNLKIMDLKQFHYSQLKANALQRIIVTRDSEIESYNGKGDAPEHLDFGIVNYPELSKMLGDQIDKLIPTPPQPFEVFANQTIEPNPLPNT